MSNCSLWPFVLMKANFSGFKHLDCFICSDKPSYCISYCCGKVWICSERLPEHYGRRTCLPVCFCLIDKYSITLPIFAVANMEHENVRLSNQWTRTNFGVSQLGALLLFLVRGTQTQPSSALISPVQGVRQLAPIPQGPLGGWNPDPQLLCVWGWEYRW